jgi:hypothetical protein
MSDADDGDEHELEVDPCASVAAARQVAQLTGMSADSARTYAAFLSGRWAQEDRRAA